MQLLHAALCSQLKDCSETSRDLTMKCLAQLAGLEFVAVDTMIVDIIYHHNDLIAFLAAMHPSTLPAQPPPSLEPVGGRRQPQALKRSDNSMIIISQALRVITIAQRTYP